jgi:methionine synthase I (cobalamin-dependent)
MNRPAFDELIARRVVMLDGGFGSMLIAAGLEPGRAPDWWTLERPDAVAAVHRAYVEAGSDVIHANTFGSTPAKLAAVGLAGRCREVNAAAVVLVRSACGPGTLVAGDIGPTGLLLPPMGAASVAEMRVSFAEQAAALAGAGVDLLSIETMFDLREALAALEAAKETGLPVVASMTFEARPRGFATIMGNRLAPALAELEGAGANAVGCNCSVPPEAMVGMVQAAVAAVRVPVAAQPNAGAPVGSAEGVTYEASPAAFARDLVAMVRAGARLVGGCCGTTPEFIRAARAALAAEGLA